MDTTKMDKKSKRAYKRILTFLMKNIRLKEESDDELVTLFEKFIADTEDVPVPLLAADMAKVGGAEKFVLTQGRTLKRWNDEHNYISLKDIEDMEDLLYLLGGKRGDSRYLSTDAPFFDVQVYSLWNSLYSLMWLILRERYDHNQQGITTTKYEDYTANYM